MRSLIKWCETIKKSRNDRTASMAKDTKKFMQPYNVNGYLKLSTTYYAKLVACRYSQVPGVNLSENELPVMNDIIFRVLMLTMIHFDFSAKVIDVNAAFLCEELEQKNYYVSSQYESHHFGKRINGLVQAARQYNKKPVKILKKVGFTVSNLDPASIRRKKRKV